MSEYPLISNRWEEMQEVFEAALGIEEAEWASFLASRCGDDTELAAQLLKLLIADRNSSQFLAKDPLQSILPLKPTPTKESLQIGDVLCGRFELLGYLGAGGMGQVYEAVDLELNQRIAIKAIRADIAELPGVLTRFKREVYTTRKINHPNVCRTFDLESHSTPHGYGNGSPMNVTFLTMELLRGETLAERINRTGRLSAPEILEVALQAGYALRAAHAAGVIHCDLKPSNVFLTRSQTSARTVVTDFGIARIAKPEDQSLFFLTQSQTTLGNAVGGTPAYMAPEQFERGQCSPASDIYSFGLILYEAMTGERLFPLSRSAEQLRRRLNDAGVEANQSIQWSVLLASCLQDNPAARWSNIQQVLDVLEGKTSVNTRQASAELVRRVHGVLDRRGLWAAGAILTACVAGGMLWYRSVVAAASVHTQAGSVVVLPFDNPGGELALKSLGNTFAEDLTNDLARFSGLTVTSQTDIAGLGLHPDLGALSRQTHVDSVVQGSVTRAGDGLLIQVALVDSKSGAHRWGQRYERRESELHSLEEDISLDVADVIRRDAGESARSRGFNRQTTAPAAEDAYRKGESALASNTPQRAEAAASDFQQAVDSDPKFAAAYERLAQCYLLMANNYNRPEAANDLRARASTRD